MSLGFGLAFGLVLPRLPAIPGPLAWGGLVMPLLWTASSYGLMGVVNPVLQERVDWPWFVVSQFVFGVVAAIVVVRSEQIDIPPAGQGPIDVRISSRARQRVKRGQRIAQTIARAADRALRDRARLADCLLVLAAGCDLPGQAESRRSAGARQTRS